MDTEAFRKKLHRIPELSGEEAETASEIVKQLSALGYKDIRYGFSGHSVLAIIGGKEPGPDILYRCDTDALPVSEASGFEHRSVHDGIMHACGHDGHMAIMMRFAEMLAHQNPKRGRVLLLFQAAEETGRGAAGVLNSGILDEFDIQMAFALHNIPGYPEGCILTKSGSFSAAVESISIEFHGLAGHAAEPENTVNPAIAVSETIAFMHSLCMESSEEDYFIATPVFLHSGTESLGTSAADARLIYTCRAYRNDVFQKMKKTISDALMNITSRTKGLQVKCDWIEPFRSIENSDAAFKLIHELAQGHQWGFYTMEKPFRWGEDFGEFTLRYQGLMFGLGAGLNVHPLHHHLYDFPDGIIDAGAQVFYTLQQKLLI